MVPPRYRTREDAKFAATCAAEVGGIVNIARAKLTSGTSLVHVQPLSNSQVPVMETPSTLSSTMRLDPTLLLQDTHPTKKPKLDLDADDSGLCNLDYGSDAGLKGTSPSHEVGSTNPVSPTTVQPSTADSGAPSTTPVVDRQCAPDFASLLPVFRRANAVSCNPSLSTNIEPLPMMRTPSSKDKKSKSYVKLLLGS